MAKKKVTIKIGFPKEKQIIYPPKLKEIIDSNGHKISKMVGGGQSVAEVASWNEHGTDKIPSRPFFKTAIEDNRAQIKELVAEAVKKKITFNQVGIEVVNKSLYTHPPDHPGNGVDQISASVNTRWRVTDQGDQCTHPHESSKDNYHYHCKKTLNRRAPYEVLERS
jgi:hypothetical protein